MAQQLIFIQEDYGELDSTLKQYNAHRIFLVCGDSLWKLSIGCYFDSLYDRIGIEVIRFSDFSPNPTYDSVVKGVNLYIDKQCDLIIGAGGGSAMDVAKCIKLFATMNPQINYLKQVIIPNDIKLFAIPTTAGTGSEATRYAVIYYKDEKQSVTDDSCIPSVVVMDAGTLKSLPAYQRKSTMLDALCHAIESFWSVHSTDESKHYAKIAITSIMNNMNAYLGNEENGNAQMLEAAYMAGKAINITQTTAGHAMCYKLTTLYKISHGHAVALCVAQLWPYMLNNITNTIDIRGKDYLRSIFDEMAILMGCDNAEEGVIKFQSIVKACGLEIPKVKDSDYYLLKTSVNPERLKNNPVFLDEMAINYLYHQIFRGGTFDDCGEAS